MFASCSSLRYIKLPLNIKTIPGSFFQGAVGVNIVNLSELTELTTIDSWAFDGTQNLVITLPDSVTTINTSAFESAFKTGGSITINPTSQLTTIANYAFSGSLKLESIYIPSTVRSIGKYAFLGCSSLLDFSVSTSNTAFKTLDGVLYSKDGTRLICYPAMRGKTSCVISAEVTTIENGAFSGVKTLKNIYYTGSAADWTLVVIGSNNEVLESIRLTCNYKE